MLRRTAGGLLAISSSKVGIPIEFPLRSRDGRGEDLNASMRSVSGTGSIDGRAGNEELHAGQSTWLKVMEVGGKAPMRQPALQ